MKLERKIRIIIADDHPIFRSGLKQIIEEDENIIILGEADNGKDALRLIRELKPDIVLLDIDMPLMTGIQVLRELGKQDVKTIFLTVYADEDIYDEGMELGISGYVLKDSAISDIMECIYKVNEGKYYISPSVSNFIFGKKNMKKSGDKKSLLESLTRTEKLILKLISEGRTSKEISEMLDASFKTIENHRTNISGKLNLKGTNSLIQFAIENKTALHETEVR